MLALILLNLNLVFKVKMVGDTELLICLFGHQNEPCDDFSKIVGGLGVHKSLKIKVAANTSQFLQLLDKNTRFCEHMVYTFRENFNFIYSCFIKINNIA